MNTEKEKTSEVVAGRFQNTSLGKRLLGVAGGNSRSSALAIAAVMVLLLLGAGLYNFQHAPKCSDAILSKAQRALDPTYQSELPAIAKEVLGIRGYKHDANCAYIVTAYYIQINDLAKAKASLSDLQKVYDYKHGLSPKLGYFYVQSIPSLKSQIAALEQQQHSIQPDTSGFPLIRQPASNGNKK